MFGSFVRKIASAFHGGQKATPQPNTSQGVSPNSAALTYNQGQMSQPGAPFTSQPLQALSYYQPMDYVDSSGNNITGSGGGGGSYTAQPDTSALQQSVRNRISAIQGAYANLQGAINPLVQDKVSQYLQNYNTQAGDLNKAYGNAIGQTQAMYGARGLGDSSFQGNALDTATGTYNENLNSLNQDKTSKLASIGQYAQGLKSGAQSASDQYGQYLNNLGNYSASDLSSLDASLANALPGVQQQAANLGTNQQFLNTLAQYAPQVNQGSQQLASQLQNLVTSSAPIFAKKQIAAGLVKSAQLTDPSAQSYWNDYFNQLLSQGA